MSTFKPILFSTEMVKAILNGSKTQTRRIVKKSDLLDILEGNFTNEIKQSDAKNNNPYKGVDVLWVRESFFCTNGYKNAPLFKDQQNYVYKASENFIGCHKWKPSIHMPKEACRLFLKIKSIRVERLRDISEEDSLAEGIHGEEGSVSKRKWYRKFVSEDEARSKGLFTESAKECFQSLWHSINGEESWNSNPWVWVIEFERIEKPENF